MPHPTKLFKAYFRFDEGPRWIGYTDGQRWNGWGMPRYDKETMEALMEWWNANSVDPSKPHAKMYYNAEFDEYVIPLVDCGFDEEEDPNERIEGRNVDTEDGRKHLYHFGGFYCWNEDTFRHTKVVELDEMTSVQGLIAKLQELDPEAPLAVMAANDPEADFGHFVRLVQTEGGVVLEVEV